MARREILVFDIGGTNVRGAIYDPVSGALLRSERRATCNFLSRPDSNAWGLFEATIHEAALVGRSLTDGVIPAR
jgi:sugar (pentulose or hexulose) kinase